MSNVEYRLPDFRPTVWQASALRYLDSGDAVILARPETGLTRATRTSLSSDGMLTAAGTYRVYLTDRD